MAGNINTPPIITQAGVELAVANSANHLALKITHISIGTAKYNPTGKETKLKNERLKTAISTASKTNDKTIQFRANFRTNSGSFVVSELGIWSNNTLIAIYSSSSLDESGLFTVSNLVDTIVDYALSLEAMPIEQIEVVIDQNLDKAAHLISLHENHANPHPQYAPKTLTATTKNSVSADGHTHEIAKASTTQAGLVQLNNTLTSTATNQALTAAQGKALNDRITTVQTTANSKWTAVDGTAARKGIVQLNSAINSTSTTQAATPSAVKQAYDRASTAINNAQTAQTIANGKQSPATTLAGYGIADFIHKNLTSENLNDIKKTGVYGQDKNVNATVARNYPEQKAGALLVRPSAYGFMQEYIVWDNYNRYIRNQNSSGGWASWERIDDKVERSGDTITGNLIIDKTARNEWSALYLKSKNGNYRFEGNPDDDDNRMNIVHQQGNTQKYLRFRKFNDGDFVAYENWVSQHLSTRLPLSGGTLTGSINVKVPNSDYSGISQYNTSGNQSRIETVPHNNNNFYKVSYRNNAGTEEFHSAFFPKSGTGKIVAYQDWVNSRLTWANITGKPQVEPNLVPLFKGEFHQVGIARNVTVGRVNGADITLAQSFKNFRYLVCVTCGDDMAVNGQNILMTSLIPVGNTIASTFDLAGVNQCGWHGRFISNTVVRCLAENCVLLGIYGTNAL